MYAKASPFSLALAMLVLDQAFSLFRELKFLPKKKKKNERKKERKAKIKMRQLPGLASC